MGQAFVFIDAESQPLDLCLDALMPIHKATWMPWIVKGQGYKAVLGGSPEDSAEEARRRHFGCRIRIAVGYFRTRPQGVFVQQCLDARSRLLGQAGNLTDGLQRLV